MRLPANIFAALVITVLVPALVFAKDGKGPKSHQKLDVFIDSDTSILDKPVSFAWGQDPFKKTPGYFYSEPKQESLHLSAIVHSEGGRSVAIINNMSAFLNSKVLGYVVKEIGTNYVVLEKNNFTKELVLAPVEDYQSSEITIWDRLPAAAPDESEAEE